MQRQKSRITYTETNEQKRLKNARETGVRWQELKTRSDLRACGFYTSRGHLTNMLRREAARALAMGVN